MDKILLLSMKNTMTHNVAQQLMSGTSDEVMYEYLGAVADYLLNDPFPQSIGVTLDDVYEIYLYAWNNAPAEVEMIRQMYEQQGIKVNVEGHGGSQIHPSIMIEQLLSKS